MRILYHPESYGEKYFTDYTIAENNNINKIKIDFDKNKITIKIHYNIELIKKTKSMLNCVMNALRFYYGRVLHKRFIYNVKRTKQDKKLPVVFSREEI